VKAEFWHERWEKGEIGFHQHEFNRYMQTFVGRLDIREGAHILVPLCGKSLDMLWLAEKGYRVTGIEISERAVRDFFAENQLSYRVDRRLHGDAYLGETIELLCGDFFAFGKSDLARIDAVYDRASLIALPPEMRVDYVQHLTALLDPGVRSLLVTLDYPQEQMRGPPFSVTQEEVRRLFGAGYEIEMLRSEDCLAREPRFREKGLTRLEEQVSLLQKKAVSPAGSVNASG